MPAPLQPGPFAEIPVPGGRSAPLYLIPFDKHGRCIGPKTLDHLMQAAQSGAFTDIHLYSHGWNNVFREAVAHYTEFFTGYFQLRQRAGLSGDRYKPLLAGMVWPSTALVSKDEQTPQFAATAPITDRAAALEADLAIAQDLADTLPPEDVPRFFELANAERISRAEALELAEMLLPIVQRESADGEGLPQRATAESLVKAWEEAERDSASSGASAGDGRPGALPDDDDESGTGNAAAAPDAEVRSAGVLDFLNPKEIIRKATVYQMKDRAGIVGTRGVAPVLQALLAKTDKPVHLTGHSYGAKVVLSALTGVAHPRTVRSLLLLQPAVNAFCFAEKIAEQDNKPGGYRTAFDRCERPVLTTFSSHDSPLTSFFHLALRRDGDLGELRAAAGPPSKFAALGGFGPGGMKAGESVTLGIKQQPEKYDFSNAAIRLIALDGGPTNRISAHGDVRNEFTEWALINLVSGSELS